MQVNRTLADEASILGPCLMGREGPVVAHKRPGSCAGKGLLTEAGLKSPIFYSEDFAFDGAATLEKLGAMQMEGIVSKNVEAPYQPGRNESWLKIKCVQRAKFPIVGFVKGPAGVAALHVAKRERKDSSMSSRHRLQSKTINGNRQEA